MKKCINCGNQLNDNQKFCPVCGVKQPDTDRGPKDPGNKGGNKGKNNGDRTIMIIGIVALAVSVVVLASVLVLVHFLKGKKSNSGDDESQVVFTEEEYRDALEAYSEYIETYADEYNSGEFAADIMLDSIGNPVLVTYDYIDDDNETLNILWYDGKDVECIYEFSGSDEFDTVYLCTDGIFYYPDYDTETLDYYQISGGEVKKILTQSEDSEAVIYYEDKQYELDFMDAETYCNENEELLEKFYISIYDEEIVNSALKNYSAFDLMSTGGVENLSNMGSILSPYYSYSNHDHDIFEKGQIENLISELKDNYINTQKEFYIYKENFIDGNIYVDDSQRKAFCGDVLYDNAIVMRDINWFYEMNILDSYFENNPYMDYKDVFIESIRFPADAFGYESWNELICLCNQNDEDADNAAYIYEYMESYVGIIKIQDLIDKYGTDWKSIVEEYSEWVRSDEFADKVSDTGERLENGEDIFADFDEDAEDFDVTEEPTKEAPTTETPTTEASAPEKNSANKELSVYLGTNIFDFVSMFDDMFDAGATDGCTEYHNDYMIVCTDYDDYDICDIWLRSESGYCVYGIYYGMNVADVKNTLIDNGYNGDMYTDDGEDIYATLGDYDIEIGYENNKVNYIWVHESW